jgi:hypothetical protein
MKLAGTENGISSNAQIDQMWSCDAIKKSAEAAL